jgi:hypothetical protein
LGKLAPTKSWRATPDCEYEDFAVGVQSLRRLSAFDFQVGCFDHGKAIVGES